MFFVDKSVIPIYNQIIVDFIAPKPYIIPRFIKDTCACIDDRGTHHAALTIQKYMRRMQKKYGDYYILKCYIKKYFYSINKNILFDIMKKKISDQKLLNFTKKMIFDNDEDIGIPIGNYTSQYFANIYLNELDHYIKEELRVKYYVRYMDDFILLLEDKSEAKRMYELIKKFVNTKLELELNSKTKYYPSKMGTNFCGYVIYETHMLLRKRSKTKIKKKIRKWNKKYLNGELDIHSVILKWNSWNNHAKHANSYNFRNKMYERILFKEKLNK